MSQMYYVYVLYSISHDKLYIGSCAEPDERLIAHNAGRGGWVQAIPDPGPAFCSKSIRISLAGKRGRSLKSGWGRRWLQKFLNYKEGWLSGLRQRS